MTWLRANKQSKGKRNEKVIGSDCGTVEIAYGRKGAKPDAVSAKKSVGSENGFKYLGGEK